MANRLSPYFGNYPAEYNRAIHGPYVPTRYYGPRDTPLSEVKVNEMVSWLNRRNVHPFAIWQAMGRAYYRFTHRFVEPRYASPVRFFFQVITMSSIFFYMLNYPKNLRHHKQAKYHW
ncbi:ATP synthase, subunit F [Dermatophagoides farinae]|uniref:ATP synthase, subunit F n=1 Tax=Dermatophagoides farinae TaxID=6954 RepID=UPI003F64055E